MIMQRIRRVVRLKFDLLRKLRQSDSAPDLQSLIDRLDRLEIVNNHHVRELFDLITSNHQLSNMTADLVTRQLTNALRSFRGTGEPFIVLDSWFHFVMYGSSISTEPFEPRQMTFDQTINWLIMLDKLHNKTGDEYKSEIDGIIERLIDKIVNDDSDDIANKWAQLDQTLKHSTMLQQHKQVLRSLRLLRVNNRRIGQVDAQQAHEFWRSIESMRSHTQQLSMPLTTCLKWLANKYYPTLVPECPDLTVHGQLAMEQAQRAERLQTQPHKTAFTRQAQQDPVGLLIKKAKAAPADTKSIDYSQNIAYLVGAIVDDQARLSRYQQACWLNQLLTKGALQQLKQDPSSIWAVVSHVMQLKDEGIKRDYLDIFLKDGVIFNNANLTTLLKSSDVAPSLVKELHSQGLYDYLNQSRLSSHLHRQQGMRSLVAHNELWYQHLDPHQQFITPIHQASALLKQKGKANAQAIASTIKGLCQASRNTFDKHQKAHQSITHYLDKLLKPSWFRKMLGQPHKFMKRLMTDPTHVNSVIKSIKTLSPQLAEKYLNILINHNLLKIASKDVYKKVYAQAYHNHSDAFAPDHQRKTRLKQAYMEYELIDRCHDIASLQSKLTEYSDKAPQLKKTNKAFARQLTNKVRQLYKNQGYETDLPVFLFFYKNNTILKQIGIKGLVNDQNRMVDCGTHNFSRFLCSKGQWEDRSKAERLKGEIKRRQARLPATDSSMVKMQQAFKNDLENLYFLDEDFRERCRYYYLYDSKDLNADYEQVKQDPNKELQVYLTSALEHYIKFQDANRFLNDGISRYNNHGSIDDLFSCVTKFLGNFESYFVSRNTLAKEKIFGARQLVDDGMRLIKSALKPSDNWFDFISQYSQLALDLNLKPDDDRAAQCYKAINQNRLGLDNHPVAKLKQLASLPLYNNKPKTKIAGDIYIKTLQQFANTDKLYQEINAGTQVKFALHEGVSQLLAIINDDISGQGLGNPAFAYQSIDQTSEKQALEAKARIVEKHCRHFLTIINQFYNGFKQNNDDKAIDQLKNETMPNLIKGMQRNNPDLLQVLYDGQRNSFNSIVRELPKELRRRTEEKLDNGIIQGALDTIKKRQNIFSSHMPSCGNSQMDKYKSAEGRAIYENIDQLLTAFMIHRNITCPKDKFEQLKTSLKEGKQEISYQQTRQAIDVIQSNLEVLSKKVTLLPPDEPKISDTTANPVNSAASSKVLSNNSTSLWRSGSASLSPQARPFTVNTTNTGPKQTNDTSSKKVSNNPAGRIEFYPNKKIVFYPKTKEDEEGRTSPYPGSQSQRRTHKQKKQKPKPAPVNNEGNWLTRAVDTITSFNRLIHGNKPVSGRGGNQYEKDAMRRRPSRRVR